MFDTSHYKLSRISSYALKGLAVLIALDVLAWQFGYTVGIRGLNEAFFIDNMEEVICLLVAASFWIAAQSKLALLDIADTNRQILEVLRDARPAPHPAPREEPVLSRPKGDPPRAIP